MQESSKNQTGNVVGVIILLIIVFVVLMALISNSGSSNSKSSNSIGSNSKYSDYHVCEVSGCNKKGEYAIEGFNGTKEYYCYEHYSKLMENMNKILG